MNLSFPHFFPPLKVVDYVEKPIVSHFLAFFMWISKNTLILIVVFIFVCVKISVVLLGKKMVISVSQLAQIWDRVLDRVQARLNDRHIFDSFFLNSYIYGIDGKTMVVVLNSALAVNLLSTKYGDMIASSVREVTESDFILRYVQEADVKKVVLEENQKSSFFTASTINRKYTFDGFVQGTSNNQAKQAAIMVAKYPGQAYNLNPLFIFSQSGLGKTHLLHAIGDYVKNNSPALKVLYITTDDFVDEFIRYVRGEHESENLKDFFKTVDILMVDDIQFLADKTKTEEMFFHIFNQMINAGKQIVLTSDRHPSELRGLEDRLVSRFGSGLTVSISRPEQETLLEILKRKIDANGLDLSSFDQDVLEFFAHRFSNNIRELEGGLNRLIFYVINIKQAKHITMDVALEAVHPLVGNNGPKTALTEKKIIDAVADYYGLTAQQLQGRIRTRQISLARHIAMYLIRSLLDTPFLKIGFVFGGKDHSTVMSAYEKVDKSLKTDQNMVDAINQLKKRLLP